jgi:hypothetical protein
MEKEKIAAWIERFNQAEKKDRATIVDEMAKENNIKAKDAWKILREAGFDPNAGSQDNPPPEGNPQAAQAEDNPQAAPSEDSPQAKPEEKKLSVVLRHKTEYQRYRCAGLVLTQRLETYQATEAQLAKLKSDPWVEIIEDKEAKAE